MVRILIPAEMDSGRRTWRLESLMASGRDQEMLSVFKVVVASRDLRWIPRHKFTLNYRLSFLNPATKGECASIAKNR